jgi:polysaccharide export outer membrane protein
MKDRLSITDVAKDLGVTSRTIMRWEKSGKIRKSKRDWRGWRFYTSEDVEDIKRFYESAYEYDELERSIVSSAKEALVGIIAIMGILSLFMCAPGYAEEAAAVDVPGVVETPKSVDIVLEDLPVADNPNAPMVESTTYTLGPEDVIAIEVKRHPEFSGEYKINSEGKIEYKYVGDVIVEGMTKKELKESITGLLTEYLIEPQVNVQIVAYLSKVFYVVGDVGRPGKFYMRGNTITVREALVQSGLPTHAAAMRRSRLITPDQQKKNNYKDVDVYSLLYEGNLKQNLVMSPGDVLYVPATVMAKIMRIVSPVSSVVAETAGHAARGAAIAAVAL